MAKNANNTNSTNKNKAGASNTKNSYAQNNGSPNCHTSDKASDKNAADNMNRNK